jgi:hypothetical protein
VGVTLGAGGVVGVLGGAVQRVVRGTFSVRCRGTGLCVQATTNIKTSNTQANKTRDLLNFIVIASLFLVCLLHWFLFDEI